MKYVLYIPKTKQWISYLSHGIFLPIQSFPDFSEYATPRFTKITSQAKKFNSEEEAKEYRDRLFNYIKFHLAFCSDHKNEPPYKDCIHTNNRYLQLVSETVIQPFNLVLEFNNRMKFKPGYSLITIIDTPDRASCYCCGLFIPTEKTYRFVLENGWGEHICPFCIARMMGQPNEIAEQFNKDNPDFHQLYEAEIVTKMLG